jgi:hypothetical protein
VYVQSQVQADEVEDTSKGPWEDEVVPSMVLETSRPPVDVLGPLTVEVVELEAELESIMVVVVAEVVALELIQSSQMLAPGYGSRDSAQDQSGVSASVSVSS